jgi:hypothetical protein
LLHWYAGDGVGDGVAVTVAVIEMVAVTEAVIDVDTEMLGVTLALNDLDGASIALVKHSKLPAGHSVVSIA